MTRFWSWTKLSHYNKKEIYIYVHNRTDYILQKHSGQKQNQFYSLAKHKFY